MCKKFQCCTTGAVNCYYASYLVVTRNDKIINEDMHGNLEAGLVNKNGKIISLELNLLDI